MSVPQIRFKKDDGSDYPEWEDMRMDEIFTEIVDKNHPEMQVLSIKQGVGTVLRDESDRNMIYDKANLKSYKAMKVGDFIIHLRSFEGGLECASHDGISSPAYKILRTDKLIPQAFKGYFRSYEFIEGKLSVAVTGIRDGKNIEMPTFWEIQIPVPCIEEQTKIATFLSQVDDVISASEEEVAKLEQLKKGMMQKIFSQEVRFKKDDGNDYPEWEHKTLKDVFGKVKRKNKDGAISLVLTNSAEFGIIPQRQFFDKDIANTDSGNTDGYYVVEPKTFVYNPRKSKSAPHGPFQQYKGSEIGIMSPLYNCLTKKSNDNDMYLDYYFKSSSWYRYVYENASQGARSDRESMTEDVFMEIPIYIPCLEEQTKIAEFFSSMDDAIAATKEELDAYKLLKKGLLQQMFI